MTRTVFCKRLQKDLPGLESSPFEGGLGKEIFENTSQESWDAWRELQIKIINEYKLDLSEIANQEILAEQMRNFLKLDSSSEDKDKKTKTKTKILHVGTPTE